MSVPKYIELYVYIAYLDKENDKAIFVANAAQHMVISACHRDPCYVIDEELEDDDASTSTSAAGLQFMPPATAHAHA